MKYLYTFLFLFLFLFFSIFGFADSPNRSSDKMVLPDRGVSPYLTADLIYWKGREDALSYVLSGVGNGVSKGRFYHPPFKGHVGLKVGVGLDTLYDNWGVYLQYTWLHADEFDRYQGDFGELLVGESFLIGGVTGAKAHWNFYINTLDLELGRTFHLTSSFSCRPFTGFKGFWSDQDFKVRASGFSDTNRQTFRSTTVDFREDAWGFGLRMGAATVWSLTQNFGIFANGAFALEWSRLHLRLEQLSKEATLLNISNDQYQMIPVLEMSLGLQWEARFQQGRYHLRIRWGWEEQMWWNYAAPFESFNRRSLGTDLNFQGLCIRVRLDF
jgi:hypothetical protein